MLGLELEVYEIFKKHFSENELVKTVEYCQTKTKEKIIQKKELFITINGTADLIARIESSKTDFIKWMFIFWIGQLAAIAGILIALLNVYLKK